jgi:hypothetical protein
MRPFFISSTPCKILLQEYEIPSFGQHSKILLFGKYLAFSTFPQKLSGLVSDLHAYLANIARLKRCRSLKPKPPSLSVSASPN